MENTENREKRKTVRLLICAGEEGETVRDAFLLKRDSVFYLFYREGSEQVRLQLETGKAVVRRENGQVSLMTIEEGRTHPFTVNAGAGQLELSVRGRQVYRDPLARELTWILSYTLFQGEEPVDERALTLVVKNM